MASSTFVLAKPKLRNVLSVSFGFGLTDKPGIYPGKLIVLAINSSLESLLNRLDFPQRTQVAVDTDGFGVSSGAEYSGYLIVFLFLGLPGEEKASRSASLVVIGRSCLRVAC